MADPRNDLEDFPEQDEDYFERSRGGRGSFDAGMLRESASVLPARKPLVLGPTQSVTEAIRAMQAEGRGCILITADGTPGSAVTGILTEHDVLIRIVDRGRNPVTLPLGEVMTAEPECLERDPSIAQVLNKMSVGGFRHVPVVEGAGRPLYIVSVRDVVEVLVSKFPREVLNLPSEFRRSTPSQREGA